MRNPENKKSPAGLTTWGHTSPRKCSTAHRCIDQVSLVAGACQRWLFDVKSDASGPRKRCVGGEKRVE